jgi:mRNA interferase MazF
MTTFERGDVIKVPFPYTDRATRRSRPALVVSGQSIHAQHGLMWVVMITSAANRGWPDDVAIKDLAAAGLPAPSLIRTAKIATIDCVAATRIGAVGKTVLVQAIKRVTAILSPAS